MSVLKLATTSGAIGIYSAGGPVRPAAAGRPTSRSAYAAAHVVADPAGETVPGGPATLDREAAQAFRRHPWSYGFGVAEAFLKVAGVEQ